MCVWLSPIFFQPPAFVTTGVCTPRGTVGKALAPPYAPRIGDLQTDCLDAVSRTPKQLLSKSLPPLRRCVGGGWEAFSKTDCFFELLSRFKALSINVYNNFFLLPQNTPRFPCHSHHGRGETLPLVFARLHLSPRSSKFSGKAPDSTYFCFFSPFV